MSDQLEHDQALDDLQQEEPAARGSLLQRARSLGDRFSPLPEESWTSHRPIQDQADPEATETSDHDAGDDSDFELSETAASTGSTNPKGFRKASAAFYGTLCKALLAAASGIANMSLRQDEDDHTWLMQPDEVTGIGEPLGRIAARKVPLPMGEGTASDLSDALEAGVVLAMYVTRSLGERAERRRGPQALNPMDQGEQAA